MDQTAVHEASHAVAAVALGVPITLVSIREREDEAGRVRFDTNSEAIKKASWLDLAIVKVAGEVAALCSR